LNTATDELSADEMFNRYKQAVERVIPHLPVRNGVVDIDSVWAETSLPYDLLREILSREDLTLPENVQRINTQSRVRIKGEKRGKSRRSRRKKRHPVRN